MASARPVSTYSKNLPTASVPYSDMKWAPFDQIPLFDQVLTAQILPALSVTFVCQATILISINALHDALGAHHSEAVSEATY